MTLLMLILSMRERPSDSARADSAQSSAASRPTTHPQKHRPEDWSEDELRAFRGAISTVRFDIPFGPRPGKPDNVVFTPMYGCYSPADRARMRAAYKRRGYTHWAIGPLIAGNYHGKYPDDNELAHPDHFEDLLEELWNDGLVPVVFVLPLDRRCGLGKDGNIDWNTIDRVLTPIYRTPRFQRLARVVVLAWEPNDGKIVSTQAQWLAAVRWMARVFPHALRYIHMTAGHDAPCDDSCSEAAAWRAIAPYLHGWLVQDGHFGQPDPNGAGLNNFRTRLQTLVAHLHVGKDGWPTTSATPGRPLDIVAFEYASYWSFWNNRPESEAQRWGAAAMSVDGIAGFGDGGPARDK
ncbi:MAG TPA: hypothetical protein VN541_12055 [Tepidisphaeraceae bacterium]|nr:hypothetical protein [Tepidisphaeraceae bacterium]